MRDRLIELLSNAPADFDGNRNVCTLAEHLLENGVIVPPCKVGDKLYWITDENTVEQWTTQVEGVVLTKDGCYVFDSDVARGVIACCDKINTQNAYLSKELAEQAMKDLKI